MPKPFEDALSKEGFKKFSDDPECSVWAKLADNVKTIIALKDIGTKEVQLKLLVAPKLEDSFNDLLSRMEKYEDFSTEKFDSTAVATLVFKW